MTDIGEEDDNNIMAVVVEEGDRDEDLNLKCTHKHKIDI